MLAYISDGRPCNVNMLQAIDMTYKAWQEVTQQTITNCFSTCGFVDIDETYNALAADEELNIEDDWRILCPDMTSTFEEYVNFDDNIAVYGVMTDEDIFQSISRNNQEGSDDDDMEETMNVSKIISVAEAQKIVQ